MAFFNGATFLSSTMAVCMEEPIATMIFSLVHAHLKDYTCLRFFQRVILTLPIQAVVDTVGHCGVSPKYAN